MRLLTAAGFILMAVPALAGEVPGEADINLAINGIMVQSQQLSRAYSAFSTSYLQMKGELERVKGQVAWWENCAKDKACLDWVVSVKPQS